MIKLRNLEKRYQTKAGSFYVLRQIDLDVQDGEFLTFMGPSGAGKSTLLGILGMLEGNWGGEYDFLDHTIQDLTGKKRVALNKQYVGFVFQQFHLIDNLTVAFLSEPPTSR